METLLPLLFSVILITFVTMSAMCLYDMYRMARATERRALTSAGRNRRAHRPSARDNLAFLRHDSRN